MTSEQDDYALLRRWQGGDGDAGDKLVRRHFDAIHRFFAHRVDVDVVDLIQRTFLALSEGRHGIPDDVGLRPYLFGIARKTLLMYARRHDRKEGRHEPLPSLAGAHASMSHVVAERQEQRVMLVALRTLPLEAQIAIELHYWEDLTVNEIAHVLGVPAGTVKARLARARKRLQEEIAAAVPNAEVAAATIRDFEAWARSLRKRVPSGASTP